MLTPYGKREWSLILTIGSVLLVISVVFHWWFTAVFFLLVILSLLSFFRDPTRKIPDASNAMLSPADGVISSIHELAHFEPFNGPAVCIRIFLSVLDVHVNRSPCNGKVASLTSRPGKFLNALNPQSAQDNQALMMILHDDQGKPVAGVQQIAGLIARTIVCAAEPGDLLSAGQRYGMIKFGSTTELYIPANQTLLVHVQKNERVYGGSTILVTIQPHA